MEEIGDSSGDSRLDWIAIKVNSCLKISKPKWKEFFSLEENKKSIQKFFASDNEMHLFIAKSLLKDELTATLQPIPTNKKVVVIMKSQPVKIAVDNYEDYLYYEEMSHNSLRQTVLLLEELYLPMIQNSKNQKHWPKVVGQDIVRQFHRFVGILDMFMGQTAGNTILPIPLVEELTNDRNEEDRGLVHSLESSIIDWTREIKKVIEKDSEKALVEAEEQGEYLGPLDEIHFWKSKSANLANLNDQLRDDKVTQIMAILEKSSSTYVVGFKKTLSELGEALKQATEIYVYLLPLKNHLTEITDGSTEIKKLPKLFRPIVHIIYLAWQECPQYNSNNVGILIRQICNDLISQIYNHIEPAQLWENDLSLTSTKLRESIVSANSFKSVVAEYRDLTSNDNPQRVWRLERNRVFTRFDLFIERLQDLLDIIVHIEEFSQLEKIDIGGLKGGPLSLIVTQIYREFQKLQTKIQTAKYDVLDVKQTQFEKDFLYFCTCIQDYDKRLGYVISKGYEACPTISAQFKLLESFETHMRRDIIKTEVEDKYMKLLNAFNNDLTTVYHIFNTQKDDPPLLNNLPRVSGSLAWCHALIQRIAWPMQKIVRLNDSLTQTEVMSTIKTKYVALIDKIKNYQVLLYAQWSDGIEERALEKMNNKLLLRLPDSRIFVNFDKTLTACIQEVKYLTHFNMEVPTSAAKIFENRDEYRSYTSSLNHITRQYNTVMQTLLDVERPLVQDQLKSIDLKLSRGIEVMDWNNNDIQAFIDDSKDGVKDLYNRLNVLKGNVKTIEKMVNSWKELYTVMTNEEEELEEIEYKPSRFVQMMTFWRNRNGARPSDNEECVSVTNAMFMKWKSKTNASVKHLSDVVKHGQKIHLIVSSSNEKVGVAANSPEWRGYIIYLNNLVSTGLYQAIQTSLEYLINSFIAVQNANDNGVPITDDLNILLQVRLELQGNQASFKPDVSNDTQSIQHKVNYWLEKVFDLSMQIRRLDDPSQNFYPLIKESAELDELKRRVKDLLDLTVQRMIELKSSFVRYAYLWEENPKEFLHKFVHGKSELDKMYGDLDDDDDDDDEKHDQPPKRTLEEFEYQIVRYEKLLQEIQELPETVCFGWLTVDCQPIRDAIIISAGKWRLTFLEYLLKQVQDNLLEFDKFVEHSKEGLVQEVGKNDYEKLKEVMGYLLHIKERPESKNGENHFEPLKQTVQLLKKYEIKVPQEIVTQLDDAKNKWKDLQKLYFEVKDNLAGLQNEEIKKISAAEANFMHECANYREYFLKAAPFNYDISILQAYRKLDDVHSELSKYEDELKNMREKQKLFTLIPNNGKPVKDCRIDLRLLKKIWDLASLVDSQFAEWRNISFLQLDCEDIHNETKILRKELRDFDKKVKRWNVFLTLQQSVQNFMDTLPLVQQLRNNGMRDRHWKELMDRTGVKFELSNNFKLDNLLALNLHKFSDEVTEIVDKATKEIKMEKYLSDLKKLWGDLRFEFKDHPENPMKIVRIPEEVVENLEDHQVQLQNSRSNRSVDHFMADIDEWLKTLGDVDTIIALLTEVQRKWLYLENIFIGSEDIREQLPDDTKRFEGVDRELKKILKQAESLPQITQFCSQLELEATLNLLQEQLDVCENKLSAYLEEKKKAFPRFYFVSIPDLLDILSKGGQSPHLVMKHMPKLFQAVQTLKFREDENGNKTNEAVGVYSREGEYVEFIEPILLSGKVEIWLQKVLTTIEKSLRSILSEGIQTYEEKPREEWLLHFPSQIVLVACQIYWTQDVNVAFEALEENNEGAMRNYYNKQIDQLNKLIKMVQGELTADVRQKIMNLVTIDVHARDVVEKLILSNVVSSQAFEWQCQLRQRWDDANQDCIIEICDATFKYGYEYLGNGPRLVITPLTDRIYITLTQSLHLIMGGAPAGPAGTGKTETTKDLGSQLGKAVYVFNCSDQMDNTTLGDIFKGLASSGSWGCFDEFNRISAEVLSVVSTQFKSILDAIKAKKTRFIFETDEISLDPTIGAFITMNPGYLGRTELPESLKALFRPVTVVVPDLELICENMLMAEGFINAKRLAKKFITLYSLNRDLLSKQGHYDWGLRAIKSVLVVAGALKRADPDFSEDHILMRALRDFNLPKIVVDDLPVFMGLIEDLFPGVEMERKVDEQFEKTVAKVITQSGLQAEDNLVLKVVQLEELLFVRHCVFIIGPAGAGKTVSWKALAKAITTRGDKVTVKDLNPKAITSNDLYGYFNEATGEWKNGLLSSMMKSLGEIEDTKPKWIILDGDLDTEWIESMNSVMDDNRLLTLANNDRIPLLKHMRLIFEISHLHYATPATVSRAGILFISEKDIGWQPYVASWIDKRPSTERTHMTILFDRYVTECLNYVRTEFKHITPLSDFSMVCNLCHMLEGLITATTVPNAEKELLEQYFVFAAIWSFGGAILQTDKTTLSRFDKWWRSTWKNQVKFPEAGTVFDYFFSSVTNKFESWEARKPKFIYNPEIPLSNVIVPTDETICIRYFLDLITDIGKPFMLVGNAGTGKTKQVQEKLLNLDSARATSCTINFNYYTDSASLQRVMEQPLDKKGGTRYGPPGSASLIYFIDDLNMPAVDNYGTQTPIALLRQHMDYNHWYWYDKGKWAIKDILQVQYVVCMNPTAGSFVIDPRLQRHFVTLAVNMPSLANLKTIYLALIEGHLRTFSKDLTEFAPSLVATSLMLHEKIASSFQKNVVNFYYEFNLRHLTNIFEGMLRSNPQFLRTVPEMLRLWRHECNRVYCDRLSSAKDVTDYQTLMKQILKQNHTDLADDCLQEPLLYSHFTHGVHSGENFYDEFKDITHVKNLLEHALKEYNETYAAMNLVLFEDAISHVCRISRIIEGPNGNALLIGVGGSGKQSLSRLAAYISDFEIAQIVITRGYGVENLKEDLRTMYRKAGLKNQGTVFLFTDSQIIDEKFLVYINDLLMSGNIPDLFPNDEKEEIANAVRTEAKSNGIMDLSIENCWRFFISKVKRNLHVILCFSPVNDNFRIRSRKFPALVNCTVIDRFFAWPKDALLSVANRFLSSEELNGFHEPIVSFMSFAHEIVNDYSIKFKEACKRHTYTTPKSFLELINLYKIMLQKKRKETNDKIVRLQKGIEKLKETTKNVAEFEKILQVQKVEVEESKAIADGILDKVSKERKIIEGEAAKATEEEGKAAKINEMVQERKLSCEEEYKKALPMLIAAEEALDTLKVKELTELRSFKQPSSDIVNVFSAVLILLSPKTFVTKDRSWSAAQKLMSRGAEAFLKQLKAYNKDDIFPHVLKAIQPYMDDPNFNGKNIAKISQAAGGLCEWVKNVVNYYYAFCKVQPLKESLAEAEAQQAEAEEKLAKVRARVERLMKKLRKLEAEFEEANQKKLAVMQQAENTQHRLDLAQRFVHALASENVRWIQNIGELKQQESFLIGDVLLASAFVSYIGSFDINFRAQLVTEWVNMIRQLSIPVSDNITPVKVLTNDAEIAKWNNQKLPTDITSTENGCILTSCERWPLIIDPQLQGITWLKNMYGDKLNIVRLGRKGLLETMERAITNGETVLVENIHESIDAVLAPILGRNIIVRHGKQYIKLENEVEYDPNFKLIFHTKLSNPHYNPETQAETTLINFTVTERGLEDQLLAVVVGKERQDLEQKRAELTLQQNRFKITLKELEDSLLENLNNSGDDILGNVELIENLEKTKETSDTIKIQVEQALETEKEINSAREDYRKVAKRGSLLYFILDQLKLIQNMYQYSLDAFVVVFNRAIYTAKRSDDLFERIENLIDSITHSVFVYTNRGLFERHKLIFLTNLTLKILEDQLDVEQVDFLIRGPKSVNGGENPFVDWMSEDTWASLHALTNLKDFEKLYDDINNSSKRWKAWSLTEAPEKEPLPQDWKNKSDFQRLLVIRALRPDRITSAMRAFVRTALGKRYTNPEPFNLDAVFAESRPSTPLFFILFPGADPVKDIEELGKKLGFSEENEKFHNISLGKGQEIIAQEALTKAYSNGGWVVLQNIHLMRKWLPVLERKLEELSEGSHKDFRVFLSAEPSSDPIPQSILQSSIKITNEPPENLQANLERAFDNFSVEFLESSIKQTEFKTILFTLCFFHALVLGRRKFGFQGWSRPYSFNTGDLTISADVLFNYLEANDNIPWEDIRYIFGEIMYGGHITDKWDRRTCTTYLETLLKDDLLEGVELAPDFTCPPPSTYAEYEQYIKEQLPSESPVMFGLHPNAEIEYLSTEAEALFTTIRTLRGGITGAASTTREEKVALRIDELLTTLPENFNMTELNNDADKKNPFVSVVLQECERMNILLSELRRSLRELQQGINGELTISEQMDKVFNAIDLDQVPDTWTKLAYPSLKNLTFWYEDLLKRYVQLEEWSSEMTLPKVVWVAGLFNPMSFLTAVMQATARKTQIPLDKMCLQTEVLKKYKKDVTTAPNTGCYVSGFFLEGAGWDIKSGVLRESNLKEMSVEMPVIHVKAVPIDKRDNKSIYECPVYITSQRGPTYVFTAQLKTKHDASKWVLAGVALKLSTQ